MNCGTIMKMVVHGMNFILPIRTPVPAYKASFYFRKKISQINPQGMYPEENPAPIHSHSICHSHCVSHSKF
jgi:hypothetical protein